MQIFLKGQQKRALLELELDLELKAVPNSTLRTNRIKESLSVAEENSTLHQSTTVFTIEKQERYMLRNRRQNDCSPPPNASENYLVDGVLSNRMERASL